VALNSCIVPGKRDGRVPQNTPFNSCGGGSGRGVNVRIERGESTYLYTFAAGAPPAENAWFAAGMVQVGLLLHFLARSRRIRIFRYTLSPEPLEDTDHRPLHNLEGPLTMRHESRRKRYTMALAGTAGLALRTGYTIPMARAKWKRKPASGHIRETTNSYLHPSRGPSPAGGS